ncbi:MAG: hypothetical protein ACRC6O_13360 [Flavobacterium sp.]
MTRFVKARIKARGEFLANVLLNDEGEVEGFDSLIKTDDIEEDDIELLEIIEEY